jgi:hypothetical protein
VGFRFRGQWPQFNAARESDIKIAGHFAYLATDSLGLQIFDVADVTNPRWAGSVEPTGGSVAVDIVGNRAIVAEYTDGLQIVDITDPTAPTRLGGANFGGYAMDVDAVGDFAYVANGTSGFRIVSFANPTNPIAMGGVSFQYASRVRVVENIAYVVDPGRGLYVVDVSDKLNPISRGNVWCCAYHVEIVGNRLYAVSRSHLKVFDISTRTSPQEIGSATADFNGRFSVSGDYLYANVSDNKFTIFDLSDLSNIRVLSVSPGLGLLGGIHVMGDFAYLGSRGTLRIVDVANRSGPVRVLEETISPFSTAVHVEDNYAYLGSAYDGLNILDIRDSAHPRLVGHASVGSYVWDIEAVQSIAYLATDRGLEIFDATAPSHPARVGFKAIERGARTVQVISNYAYIGKFGGFEIIDILDRTDPVRRGEYTNDTVNYYAYSAFVSGAYAYLAADGNGFHVLDIRNPTRPTQVARVPWTVVPGKRVFVSGRYAYVAGQYHGITVFDVGNPANPIKLASVYTPGEAQGMGVVGDFLIAAFGTDYDYSIRAFMLTNQTNLLTVGYVSIDRPFDFFVRDTRAYYAGFGIYDIEPPRLTQTIDFPALPDRLLTEPPFNLAATASSGLPVVFRLLSGPVTLVGSLVTLTNTGLVTIRAEQLGDDIYLPATSVERSFTVTRPFFQLRVSATNGSIVVSPNRTTFALGEQVVLTAIPNANYAFAGWLGGAAGTNNPLTIVVSSNTTIAANFFPPALTIEIFGRGSVSRSPDKPAYDFGERVTLIAAPDRWFAFTRWGDGLTTNPRVITIGADNNFVGIFSPTTAVETLTFGEVSRTAPIGMPAIFIDGEFVVTNEVSRLDAAELSVLTTFPNGSIFYTLDGSAPSFAASLYSGPFVLRRSATVRAVAYDASFLNSWEADAVQVNIEPTFSVSLSTAGGGTVSVLPTAASYRSSSVVTLSAAPAPGWTFLQWLGDASGASATTSVRVMNRDLCAQALFGTTLNTTVAGSGSVVVDPAAALYPHGTVVRLTAVPQGGNHFGAWGNAVMSTNNPLLFTITNANPTVSCAFGSLSAGQVALTVLVDGRGRVTTSPRGNRFPSGQSIRLTATADADQEFLGWTGDATGTTTNLTVALTQSKVITANFTKRPRLSLGPCLGGWREEGFQLTLTGEFGEHYRIEQSSALENWGTLVSFTNTYGIWQMIDTAATNDTTRFYRALEER